MKTLKDLDCSNCDEYSCCYERNKEGNSEKIPNKMPTSVEVEDLRELANEWIKKLEKATPKFREINDIGSIQRWIVTFFNLIEDELK